jgi:hypothetical protein
LLMVRRGGARGNAEARWRVRDQRRLWRRVGQQWMPRASRVRPARKSHARTPAIVVVRDGALSQSHRADHSPQRRSLRVDSTPILPPGFCKVCRPCPGLESQAIGPRRSQLLPSSSRARERPRDPPLTTRNNLLTAPFAAISPLPGVFEKKSNIYYIFESLAPVIFLLLQFSTSARRT